MLITIILSKEQKHETTQTLPIAEPRAGRFANHNSPFIRPVIRAPLNWFRFLKIGSWQDRKRCKTMSLFSKLQKQESIFPLESKQWVHDQ